MLLRLLLAITAALLLAASPASAETALNVIPHGQQGPGVPWASAPGMLPADAQARMYDRLTPLFRNVTPAHLQPSADGSGYFKSSALLPENDPSLITSQTISGTSPSAGPVTATIKRDAYGVPYIFSNTDAGAIFGAGYVVATDQALLIEFARTNGVAALLDVPGISAIQLVLGAYQYRPSKKVVDEVTAQQTRAILAQGAEGRQLLNDIDTYLAGANLRRAEIGAPPLTRTDIYAANAIKAQFLGEGGGNEIENALFLAELRHRLGAKRGDRAFEDLRARNDPEASVSTTRRAKAGGNVPVYKARGVVRLRRGSFRDEYVKLPDAQGSSSAAARAAKAANLPSESSNVIMVAGKLSATGRPLFVGGPQIGYTYPGLTLEMQIKSPSINVRGATSAPYPGYMLIGRSTNYAWTLTSAGADIVDVYAERLCDGSRRKYLYKGRCRRMERVDGGTLVKGDKSTRVTFWRTVHGPVLGYAREERTGRLVALAKKRSSRGRETTDLLFNQQMTFGRVRSARDFVRAAQRSPQTFNSFYASATEIGFFTSGALPRRPSGVSGDLPVDGRGSYEWRGLLPKSAHPQTVNPSAGMIVNWNNKPARDFPAGDDRFGSEGGIQRNDLLREEMARYPKPTLANLVAASNAGATQDVRIIRFWPTLKRMLAKTKAPSARARQLVEILDDWRSKGGSRVDANGDGRIDHPGAVILDTAWRDITDVGLCDRLGRTLCRELEKRISRFDLPPGGQYGGWHQYMWKDLRTLLGERVQGRYSMRYCARGSVSRCSQRLWRALDAAGRTLAARQGNDPTRWSKEAAKITFGPLPLTTMQYTNRPSGIHQVMEFDR
jgi:hypothetical protein